MRDEGGVFCFLSGGFMASVIWIFIIISFNDYWRRIAIEHDIGGYNIKTSKFELKKLN